LRENLDLFNRLLTDRDPNWEARIRRKFGEFRFPQTVRFMFNWLETEPIASERDLPVELAPIIEFLIQNDAKFGQLFSSTMTTIAYRQDSLSPELIEIRKEIAEKRDRRGGMGLAHDFRAMEKNSRERSE
jgi:hypothetical protein